MTSKYRVHLIVSGSVARPQYSGYVDVWAINEQDAAIKAKVKLHQTTFPDVWFDAFKVQRVEWLTA